MLKKIVIFTSLSLLLSSCVVGPNGYFKKSANNKLIDGRGSKGGKRKPLYNSKYIDRAKYNVASGNSDFDDEFDDEDEAPFSKQSISRENQEMYLEMIREDLENEKKRKKRNRSFWGRKRKTNNDKGKAYPSIVDASQRLKSEDDIKNEDIREELEEIKAMLNDAKREMASYKCPTAKRIEQGTKEPHKNVKDINRENIDNKKSEPVTGAI